MTQGDDHQRALWYWLRGICRWHQKDDITAVAADLLMAADLVVAESVRRAKEPTGQKMQPVTVRATVVHCMVTPWLRTGPWIFRDEAQASTRKPASGPAGETAKGGVSGTSAHEPPPQAPEL